MRYWVVADTHFGHTQLERPDMGNRPADCFVRMLKNMEAMIEHDDVLIHLGDVAFNNPDMGSEEAQHFHLNATLSGSKRWLVRGNHDTKSVSWYLDRGWDFVGDQIRLVRFGLEIAFSHRPLAADTYDLNIHGHCHNSRHHEDEVSPIRNPKQYLVMMEHTYAPQRLETIAKPYRLLKEKQDG